MRRMATALALATVFAPFASSLATNPHDRVLPAPPPGAGAADPWLDADGDALYGNLDVGANSLRFTSGDLRGEADDRLTFRGRPVCVETAVECRGAPGPAGPAGPPGPAGPAGPSGVAAVASKDGPNSAVSATTAFISPRATLTVAVGQKVVIQGQVALGSWSNGGAFDLDIYPCYRPSGGAIVLVGEGLRGLSVPQYQRLVYAVSGVAEPPTAGAYDVGVCGRAPSPGTWVTNDANADRGYVTAFVVNA